MHRANVNIGPAGDVADRADQSGPVKMIAQQKILPGGDDIHPEVIKLDDVYLAISECARYRGGAHIGVDL